MQQVTVWRCCCRETSSNRCSAIAVTEDGRTCIVQKQFLQTLILFAFLFLMEPGYYEIAMLCPGQGMVPYFWMLLKPWWVFPSSGAPSALEQVEPLGLLFLNLCAWITHVQHHLLVLSPGPARKAFLLLKRKCLNGSFLHSYGTFNLATLEIHVVGAACPGCYKDSLHSAGTFQGQLFGDHWPATLAGDGLVVRLDIRQCMGWALPDAEWECNTLGRQSLFFASRKTVNSCF